MVGQAALTKLSAAIVAALLLWGGMGRAQDPPRRIVSLAPSVTETLFALSLGGRVVAVSSYCNHPPDAVRLPRVGDFLRPNLEAVVGQRPDLVIVTPAPGNRAAVEALERVGLRVLVVRLERLDEVWEAIQTIGEATGEPARARALVKGLRAAVAAVSARVRDAGRPRALMVVGQRPLMAVGGGSYLDELIAAAGGENVLARTKRTWVPIGLETVVDLAPEVIVDASMGSEAGSGDGGLWARVPAVPAVRSGRVHFHRSDALLRPGPRLVEGLHDLARLIHPERFRDDNY